MMPILPHFASECIEINKFEVDQIWPKYDNDILIEDNVNFVVQINGKKRALISAKRDISEDRLLSEIKNNSNLVKYFDSKKFSKTFFVKNKLINIIT